MPLPARTVRTIAAALVVLLAARDSLAENVAENAVEPAQAVVESLPGSADETAKPHCCTMPGRGLLVAAAATARGRLSLESLPAEGGASERVRVLLGGEPFAEYRVNVGHQPAVWPIVGPSGLAMTRSLDAAQRGPAGTDDHPHHHSLWFAHGGVNSHDFWNVPPGGDRATKPQIVHTGFTRQEVVGNEAVIATTNDWVRSGEVVLRDERLLAFGEVDGAGSPRYVDFTVRLAPAGKEATFTDTKEGTFGVRVPDPMRVEARLGGAIVNSRGHQDDDAWGQPAEWVSYHGPLTVAGDGAEADHAEVEQGGIAILAHPEGFRSPCRWHVRAYGLFAANPFGQEEFPPAATAAENGKQGELVLAAGESLTLRFRAVFYAGAFDAGSVNGWYDRFAATPLRSEAAQAPSTH